MCGIAGTFAYHVAAPPVDGEELLRIRDAMTHRGPDGAGIWCSDDGRAGLAHRRLSIIDLSDAAAQPMSTPDRRLHISYNGEIYNYRELRSDLERRGHRFRSASDTEVLLYLYAERGAQMVHALRGMYAFAIVDTRERTLFLARDPFGVKPLYYADDGCSVRFASQVKALVKADGVDRSPCAAGHAGFYLWGHVPEPHTLYRGVKALAAGHTLTVDARGAQAPRVFFEVAETFRSLQHAPSISIAEARERLHAALRESVRYHLISDVPVGVFLSAGLDSTTIAALAAETHGEKGLRTLTLGFDAHAGTPQDETAEAEAVALRYGTTHETHRISRGEFGREMSRVLEAMDQPSIDGINTWFVSRAAAQAGLKVALSGVGGDELFGGYPSFRDIPRMVRSLAAARYMPGLGRSVRRAAAPIVRGRASPKYAGLLEYGGTYAGAYLLRRGLFMPWELPAIMGACFARQGLEELQSLPALERTIAGLESDRARVSALELAWYMRNQLLRDTDWAGMAHSLEIRVPLVDVELFRTVAALPALTKRELAAAPEKPLPDAIVSRRKSGFVVPVASWLDDGRRGEKGASGVRGWAKVIHPPARHNARALVLVPEAFGGRGGIAQYCRDFLESLCAHPAIAEALVFARLMNDEPAGVPEKVRHATASLGGKRKYLAALLATLAKDRAFDVIVCGHINLLPLAYLAHLATGARIVLLLYGIEAWRAPRALLTRRIAARVFALVSISRITEERFSAWAHPRAAHAYVLPNAIDLAAYGAGPRNDALAERFGLAGKRVLMTLGRLAATERYKGFDEVLDLLPRLVRRIPGLVYVIAGDGDDRERLERRAQALGVREHVVFTGYVEEAHKAALYRLADVYVHASSGEGFGFVTLEALATGLPTIASKLDGGREALRGGQLGTLVDPRNAVELEAAIVAAFAQARRVPPGLEYFSYANFRMRLHRIVDDCLGAARQTHVSGVAALAEKPTREVRS